MSIVACAYVAASERIRLAYGANLSLVDNLSLADRVTRLREQIWVCFCFIDSTNLVWLKVSKTDLESQEDLNDPHLIVMNAKINAKKYQH